MCYLTSEHSLRECAGIKFRFSNRISTYSQAVFSCRLSKMILMDLAFTNVHFNGDALECFANILSQTWISEHHYAQFSNAGITRHSAENKGHLFACVPVDYSKLNHVVLQSSSAQCHDGPGGAEPSQAGRGLGRAGLGRAGLARAWSAYIDRLKNSQILERTSTWWDCIMTMNITNTTTKVICMWWRGEIVFLNVRNGIQDTTRLK